MFAKVILLTKKQQKIMDGHPWVFPQAIHHILGHPQAGDWVWVSDDKQNIIMTRYTSQGIVKKRGLPCVGEG
jgi:23S rRNA G2069 N7-methylase RlmK/C1962 C5-methylase RlmI